MGTTSSKAVVEDIVNSYVNSLNKTALNATGSSTCANNITQVARGDCVIDNTGIVQNCKSFQDIESLQTAVQNSASDQDINSKVKNAAATVDQNISFKVNATSSNARTKSIKKLFTTINNVITSSTVANQIASNSIDQSCYDNAKFNNVSINQSALQEQYIKAIQNSQQVIDAKNGVISAIDNSAKTTVQNAIGQILMMIIIIIALIAGFPMIMTAGVARSVSRYAMVLLVMWVYIWLACSKFATKWLSFLPNWCKDEKNKRNGYIIATIISVVLVGLTIKDLTDKSNNQS